MFYVKVIILYDRFVMNAYSQDLRDRAIEIFKSNKYSQLELCTLLKISYKTINNWVKQYRSTGSCDLGVPIRVGRKRKFDDKEQVLSYLKEHPEASGKEMQEALAPHISDTAFYDSLSRMGITYKKRGKV
jgi:transposase